MKERLVEDMKSAMRAREAGKARLSVIQLVRAAVLQIEKDKQITMDDSGVLEVLAREVKQRQEAITEYKNFPNTAAMIEKLESEIKILREYLPAELTPDEIRQIVKDAVSATGASGIKDMGKIMTAVMPKTRGRADGKLVNQMVKEELTKE
jgi:uncharacterized protein YqeY